MRQGGVGLEPGEFAGALFLMFACLPVTVLER